MAELVDALVSNTNAARRAGSIPALGTSKEWKPADQESAGFFYDKIEVLCFLPEVISVWAYSTDYALLL